MLQRFADVAEGCARLRLKSAIQAFDEATIQLI
jgi:hypothetical protein